MLVISRVKDEDLTHVPRAWATITVPPSDVAQTIEVGIVDVRGDKVRLGFKADRVVNIARNELLATQTGT